MTQAKKEVVILADNYRKSKFILELSKENHDPSIKFCPECGEGILEFKEGTNDSGRAWAFWGCSNFTYGCEYKEWVTK